MAMSSNDNKTTNFRWVESPESVGKRLFTFDGKKIFNLFKDYPYALTEEEVELFDSLNPYWADFFKDRKQKNAGGKTNGTI